MSLRDLNDDNTNLGGLGRFASIDEPISDYTGGIRPNDNVGGGGIEYTPYEEVTNEAVVQVIPRVIAPEVLQPVKQTLSLPQFDFSTGVASCTSCTDASAPAAFSASDASSKLAANMTEASEPKVTPLPTGPKTINWLLILAAAGVGYMALKTDKPTGVGCLPETPEPPRTEVPLGRPPRKKPEKLKHLDSFKIK